MDVMCTVLHWIRTHHSAENPIEGIKTCLITNEKAAINPRRRISVLLLKEY